VSISKGKSVFDDKENEEIWKIFKFMAIYFQSLIRFTNTMDVVKNKTILSYLNCYVIDNQILIASLAAVFIGWSILVVKSDRMGRFRTT
jgi:hypothetical protein